MAKKMGRPTKITEEKDRQLKSICRLKPRLEDVAHFLDLDTSTIEKYIKRTYGVTFSEFRAQYMVHSRFNVVRRLMECVDRHNIKAIEMAMEYFNIHNFNKIGFQDDAEIKVIVNGNKS